jgi:hypothetical protein
MLGALWRLRLRLLGTVVWVTFIRTVRVAFGGTRKRNGNMLISWVEKSKSELRSGLNSERI